MKIIFLSGLCTIALLCAGCAGTGGRQEDSAADAVKPPQPVGESVAKSDKKPRAKAAAKPPQPVEESVAKSGKKPRAKAAAKPPQPLDEGVSEDAKKPQANPQWLPTVFVPAHYPQKALDQGIEGYVTLEFTVTKTGSLQDIVVIDSTPPGYFEEAALKASTQFRYEPKIVNGEPVDVPRAQYKMIFELKYLRPKS